MSVDGFIFIWLMNVVVGKLVVEVGGMCRIYEYLGVCIVVNGGKLL